jgi:ABC-type antimicrobial peptide transport system permease subunit
MPEGFRFPKISEVWQPLSALQAGMKKDRQDRVLIALTLATVGLYAVTAYAVAQRTREIGLRIALGAGVRHVWWLTTRRASVQLALGLLIGLTGSLAVLRVLPQEITRTSGNNSGTLAFVTALLVLIALTACLIPARRALAVDPAQTLKEG